MYLSFRDGEREKHEQGEEEQREGKEGILSRL